MQVPVKEPIKIEDGKHTGEIIAVEYRSKPFEYVDFVISFISEQAEGKIDVNLKASYPLTISLASKLGKLLTRAGFKLTKGASIELDDMKGLGVEFQTITEETPNGTFAKVLQDSVKPGK